MFWKITRWARAMRFWIFLALAAAAWAGFGVSEARAGEFGCNVGDECDRGQAHASCVSHHEAYLPGRDPSWEGVCEVGPSMWHCRIKFPNGNKIGCPVVSGPGPTNANYYHLGCPEGSVWNEAEKKCDQACADKPNLTNKYVRGSFGVCHDGCQYLQDGPLTVCLGSGPEMYCGGEVWKPSGQQCQVDDGTPNEWNPDQETCRSTGNGWNECVQPDGKHCVTGAKGTRMCWEPGETGQRNDTANIEWADRVPAGDTPTPPANIENPTQETTTADKGGVSGDAVGGSFVIGGGSGTGNSGGQSNTGSGGSGSGDGDEGDNEHGAPGSGLGNVYESDGKTVADIFGVFRARAENAPVIDAATGFLEVSAGSGCPVFTLPATEFWDSMTFDYHCSGPLADNLALGAYLLMAIAAFIAFRVAFH